MSRVILILCLFFSIQTLGLDSKKAVEANTDPSVSEQRNNSEPIKKIIVEIPKFTVEHSSKEGVDDQNPANPKNDYDSDGLEISKKDLFMQTVMAIGTASMAVFSFIALGISIAGVCLLIKNLRKTQEIINLDRAWLVPDLEQMAFVKGSNNGLEDADIFLTIPIKNTGKLPAEKVVFRFETLLFNNGFSHERLSFSPKLQALSIGVIGPGFTSSLKVPFSLNDAWEISDDFENSAFVHIEVTYNTITSKRAVSEQSFILKARGSIMESDNIDNDGVVRIAKQAGIKQAIRSSSIGAAEMINPEIQRFVGTNRMT